MSIHRTAPHPLALCLPAACSPTPQVPQFTEQEAGLAERAQMPHGGRPRASAASAPPRRHSASGKEERLFLHVAAAQLLQAEKSPRWPCHGSPAAGPGDQSAPTSKDKHALLPPNPAEGGLRKEESPAHTCEEAPLPCELCGHSGSGGAGPLRAHPGTV